MKSTLAILLVAGFLQAQTLSTVMYDSNTNIVRPYNAWQAWAAAINGVITNAGGTPTYVSAAITNQWRTDATNISGYGMSNNQYYVVSQSLDNTAWIAEKITGLNNNTNWNRFGWTNTISKLQTGQTVRVLVSGTGIAGLGLLNPIFAEWTVTRNVAGAFNWCYPYILNTSSGGATWLANPQDSNWWAPYTLLTGIGNIAGNLNNAQIPVNVCELDYVSMPGGVTFKIQTNSANGTFVDDARFSGANSIGATNATKIGVALRWTNSVISTWGYQVVSLTTGSTPIVGGGLWNNTVSNAIICGQYTTPAAGSPAAILTPGQAVVQPIIKSWAPDLNLWNGVEEQNAANAAALTTYLGWYTKSDIVLCGIHPSVTGLAGGQDVGNSVLFSMARTNTLPMAVSYFDAWSPFDSVYVFTNRLFALDTQHPNTAGISAYNAFLWAWLALDIYNQGSGISSGGTSTNTAGYSFNVSNTNWLGIGTASPASFVDISATNNSHVWFDTIASAQAAIWFPGASSGRYLTNFNLTGNADSTTICAPAGFNNYGIYFSMGGSANAKARLWYSGGLELGSYGATDPAYGGLLANGLIQAVGTGYFAGNGKGLTNITSSTNAINATNFWGSLVQSNLTVALLTNSIGGNASTATLATNAINATNLWGGVVQSNITIPVLTNNISGVAFASTNSTNFWGLLSITNLPIGLSTSNYVGIFLSPTNANNTGSYVGGNAYVTNFTADITLGNFVTPTGGGSTLWRIYLLATNSSAATHKITFPSGCVGAGNSAPAVYYITNATMAEFQINCWAGVYTNVNWSPHW